MTKYKIQSLRSLRDEMKAVARGEKPAPNDAAKPSFNSVEALVRLLTPENRRLLALIRDHQPRSVAELVQLSGRAQPNLTRTLAKLEAAGFVTMTVSGRRKAPKTRVKKILVEIDPYSENDRLRVA
ncbi:MAG: MarR family transcriptional regulator [Alphaproteobacteria bacterium]|nr:MarR family transcriptional regulator [Alphaproteobacteria bacterium]